MDNNELDGVKIVFGNVVKKKSKTKFVLIGIIFILLIVIGIF